MSLFPTGTHSNGQRFAGHDARLETDMLARPIKGQVYLIEEEDLEMLWDGRMRSPPSGLVSRH